MKTCQRAPSLACQSGSLRAQQVSKVRGEYCWICPLDSSRPRPRPRRPVGVSRREPHGRPSGSGFAPPARATSGHFLRCAIELFIGFNDGRDNGRLVLPPSLAGRAVACCYPRGARPGGRLPGVCRCCCWRRWRGPSLENYYCSVKRKLLAACPRQKIDRSSDPSGGRPTGWPDAALSSFRTSTRATWFRCSFSQLSRRLVCLNCRPPLGGETALSRLRLPAATGWRDRSPNRPAPLAATRTAIHFISNPLEKSLGEPSQHPFGP